MNRVIKFRAWDTVRRQMFAIQGMLFDEGGVKSAREKTSYLVVNSEMVVMQYTGLKDKNGKEIYEGDILSVREKNFDEVRHVKVIWMDKEAQFGVELDSDWVEPLSGNDIRHPEIIGNVYQTPNLLTNEKE